ncbi:MEP7d [Ectocarpus sp. CCAP 1310/34]|nr:MEP7d [Ectocarpus sp. CCAP 1310/34]
MLSRLRPLDVFLPAYTTVTQGNHGIIASKRCNDVSIQNNVVYDNALHGIMLHRSSDDGIIRNNTVSGSGSACIAIFESFDIEISDNLCTNNEEGIRLSMGSSYNKIFDNQVIDTAGREFCYHIMPQCGWLTYPRGAIWMYLGSDEVEASAATDGMCTGNLFQNNYLERSDTGVSLTETRDTMLIGNTFIDTDNNEWRDSDGLVWRDNDIDGDFDMSFSDTCVTSDSDFDQINGVGSNPSEC